MTSTRKETDMYTVEARKFPLSPVATPGAEGTSIQWLVDESRGAPTFAMRRFVVEAGGCTPSHQHPWEHVVYILSGEAEIHLADETVTVGPDTGVFIPPDDLHQFRNVGDEPLVFLCLVPNGPATEH